MIRRKFSQARPERAFSCPPFSLLEAEHDANEFAKAWTPSEKVAIARAIEEELRATERRGRPSNEITNNCSELAGKESREIAAEKAGFGSHMTYRRAKKVVDDGADERVEGF